MLLSYVHVPDLQSLTYEARCIFSQVAEADCPEVTNMTMSEEIFEFLAPVNWTQDGEIDLLQRSDEYHIALGLCYYKPAGKLGLPGQSWCPFWY